MLSSSTLLYIHNAVSHGFRGLNCSRKNFKFLFGALINLTVRVDTYFHPIRMTYPVQPGPFFWAASNWEKPAKNSLPQNFFEQDRHNYCLLSLLAPASRHLEESHLIYGTLESILIGQGFPVEYELDEFNTSHTGTTISHLQLWLCWLRCKIPLRPPITSFLGNIFWRHSRFSPQMTRTTH